MRFTNSPYEDFMKEKKLLQGRPAQPAAQRLPLRWLPLLARDRLRVLLPGAASVKDRGQT